MLEAISMKFLIASLTCALLMGQIVQMRELPGPHVSTLSLLHTLFLSGALFCEDTQSSFFISLCSPPRSTQGCSEATEAVESGFSQAGWRST